MKAYAVQCGNCEWTFLTVFLDELVSEYAAHCRTTHPGNLHLPKVERLVPEHKGAV